MKPSNKNIAIRSTTTNNGEVVLVTDCASYNDYVSLPSVMNYNGVNCKKISYIASASAACYKS